MTELRRAKLTFKKKIIVLLSRHLRIREDCIEDEVIVFTSRWSSRESFWIQKNSCFNIKKVLLTQNDKRYKRIRKELRYVSTHENVTSSFLRQIFVVIHINAIVNENFNEFHNRIFFKSLWRRHLWRDFDNNRSFFENDALHIRQINVINRKLDRRSV